MQLICISVLYVSMCLSYTVLVMCEVLNMCMQLQYALN